MTLGETETPVSLDAPETPASTDAPQDDSAQATDGQQQSAQGDGTTVQPDDDYDEVEFEGTQYRLPKTLKDAVLRQADYTKKTQEVAETRRALEAREQQLGQQAKAFQADIEETARLVGLNDQLKQYEKVDWDRWEREDPLAAQAGWRQYQQAQQARNGLAASLAQRDEQRAREAKHADAKRLEETESVLRRDVKGWGPEMARQIRSFGLNAGLTEPEVDSIADARLVKLLHKAMLYDQSQKAKSGGAAAGQQGGTATPLQVIPRGKAPAVRTPLSKVDNMDEYVRRRSAGEKG